MIMMDSGPRHGARPGEIRSFPNRQLPGQAYPPGPRGPGLPATTAQPRQYVPRQFGALQCGLFTYTSS